MERSMNYDPKISLDHNVIYITEDSIYRSFSIILWDNKGGNVPSLSVNCNLFYMALKIGIIYYH